MMPNRSGEQRLEGLAEANRIRVVRKEWKQRIRAGEIAAFSVLNEADAQTMRVRDLLMAVPGVGGRKVDAAMARIPMSPAKTVGGVTHRQLSALTDRFPRAVGS